MEMGKGFGVRTCPACAMEVAANEHRCPICGYIFPVEGVWRRQWVRWVAVGVLLGLVAGGGVVCSL